jgi:hypothetical protein
MQGCLRLAVVLSVFGVFGFSASRSTSAQTNEAFGIGSQVNALPGANSNPAGDFFVAPNGNDAWPGSLAQPFATVDRARRAATALKAHVSGRTITVLIRNGTYYLPSTWTFTSQDSGTSTTPILYANYPGETPVISGGQRITGWTRNGDGSWQSTLPSGRYFSQLWVNGARRYRPRTTPTGYLFITGEYSTTGSTTVVNEFSYSTKVAGGVPPKMANLSDVDVIVFEAWDVPRMRIASLNPTTSRIVTTAALPKQSFFTGFIPGHRFLLENVKEAFKLPGQWYLDRPTSMLKYIPVTGESPTQTPVVAPHLQTILKANNLSYVTFQGLTFAHSDWQIGAGGYLSGQGDSRAPAALSIISSTGVVFEADTIAHTGGYGIEFQGTGIPGGATPYLAQFRDGLISDTGAGGIRVGGVAICSGPNRHTNANVPQYIYIGNNLITGGGRVGVVGWGMQVGNAHHILIEHNEISDFYNTGIGVGYDWGYACSVAHDDVVQFNSIHNLGQGITSDLGGVYYLSGINTGNKVLNNVVHDIDHDPYGGYGGWGLYLDGGATQILVANNLVYRTTDASLHLNSWGGAPPNPPPTPNIFRNNILAYGAMGAMDRHNDTNFLSMVFENNIFYYDMASIQYGYWYCEGKPTCTNYFQLDSNIYFNKSISGGQPSAPFFSTHYAAPNSGQQPPKTPLTFTQWQATGEDRQSLFANPQFVNPTPGVDNFTLGSNSPASSIGFAPFDPRQAGRLPGFSILPPQNAPAFPLLARPINKF